MTTEFAVIIPTYRRSHYVAQAIESVLGQTHPPSEVIVVCDGPESSLPEDLRALPIRVVEQPHRGVAAARNTGVANSSSEWLCFLDDDDLWHPDRLKVTSDYLADHPDCLAVTASSFTFGALPGQGVELVAQDLVGCTDAATRTPPSTDMSYLDIFGQSFDLLLENNRGNISGSTVRRDVFLESGGFPEGLTCAEDWLMFLNVARFTEWHFIESRLSFVRKHASNNTTANSTNGLVTVRAIRSAWSETALPVPEHRPLAQYGEAYRWTIQDAVWTSIRHRNFAIAYETWREGRPLLERYRDRLYVLVPPQVSWRVEKLLGRIRRP